MPWKKHTHKKKKKTATIGGIQIWKEKHIYFDNEAMSSASPDRTHAKEKGGLQFVFGLFLVCVCSFSCMSAICEPVKRLLLAHFVSIPHHCCCILYIYTVLIHGTPLSSVPWLPHPPHLQQVFVVLLICNIYFASSRLLLGKNLMRPWKKERSPHYRLNCFWTRLSVTHSDGHPVGKKRKITVFMYTVCTYEHTFI